MDDSRRSERLKQRNAGQQLWRYRDAIQRGRTVVNVFSRAEQQRRRRLQISTAIRES